MSLTPSRRRTYVYAHWLNTAIRLRKPIRKKMCTTSHVTHAMNPDQCAWNGHTIRATAA